MRYSNNASKEERIIFFLAGEAGGGISSPCKESCLSILTISPLVFTLCYWCSYNCLAVHLMRADIFLTHLQTSILSWVPKKICHSGNMESERDENMEIQKVRRGRNPNYEISISHAKEVWLPLPGSRRFFSIFTIEADVSVVKGGGIWRYITGAVIGLVDVVCGCLMLIHRNTISGS